MLKRSSTPKPSKSFKDLFCNSSKVTCLILADLIVLLCHVALEMTRQTTGLYCNGTSMPPPFPYKYHLFGKVETPATSTTKLSSKPPNPYQNDRRNRSQAYPRCHATGATKPIHRLGRLENPMKTHRTPMKPY